LFDAATKSSVNFCSCGTSVALALAGAGSGKARFLVEGRARTIPGTYFVAVGFCPERVGGGSFLVGAHRDTALEGFFDCGSDG
jgi:hypothetical protein